MAETEMLLITGGTGFIGSHLMQALLNDGHEIIAFDATIDETILKRLGIADYVHLVQGDVTDLSSLARTIRETHTTRLVHLAALLTEDIRSDALAATRVNAIGTSNVLEVARLFPDQISRVVLISSKTVYALGSVYGDTPVKEDALLFPDSPYSAAKRYAECLADTYRKEYNVPAITLRPTGVFGPFRRSFTAFADLFENPAVGESAHIEGGEHYGELALREGCSRCFPAGGAHAGKRPHTRYLQRSRRGGYRRDSRRHGPWTVRRGDHRSG